MTKEKIQIDRISENMHLFSYIDCSKCGKNDQRVAIDEIDSAKGLLKNGWRATKNHIYCPDCAKKHLKS